MTIAQVTAAEAKRLLDEDGYVYVDVRSVQEFEAGHVEGAYNAPLNFRTPGGPQANAQLVDVLARKLGKEAKLVLGCATGQRSMRAAQTLALAGFTNVVDQKGGLSGATDPFGRVVTPGWRAAGLPIATTSEADHTWAGLLST